MSAIKHSINDQIRAVRQAIRDLGPAIDQTQDAQTRDDMIQQRQALYGAIATLSVVRTMRQAQADLTSIPDDQGEDTFSQERAYARV